MFRINLFHLNTYCRILLNIELPEAVINIAATNIAVTYLFRYCRSTYFFKIVGDIVK